MSCGVGCRRGSDPALLWLWRRPVAPAPFQALAWESPYAMGAAEEIAKRPKKKKKKKFPGVPWWFHGLRICHCQCSSSSRCCGTGVSSDLGTSTCYECSKKNFPIYLLKKSLHKLSRPGQFKCVSAMRLSDKSNKFIIKMQ